MSSSETEANCTPRGLLHRGARVAALRSPFGLYARDTAIRDSPARPCLRWDIPEHSRTLGVFSLRV
jgi:hypothetical protein